MPKEVTFRKGSPEVELYRKVHASGDAQAHKDQEEIWRMVIVEGEPLGKRKKNRSKVEESKTCPGDEKEPCLLE